MEKIRIVLAEDHTIVRHGTIRLLASFHDFEIVGEASDGQEALELVRSLKPDILLCDIRMPKFDGIAVALKVKEHSPATKVILLSAYDDEDYVLASMKAGVSGYMLKTIDINELAESIRAIQLGQTVIHPAIAAKLTQAAMQNLSDSRGLGLLSPRELEIMHLVVEDMNSQAIAEKLEISVRTVESHLGRIYAKLGISSRAGVIQYYHSHSDTGI